MAAAPAPCNPELRLQAAGLPIQTMDSERDIGLPATPAPDRSGLAVGATVPLLEESLLVDKRVVDQGGWRISKRVETRTESVDEPLRRQTVQVERRAVGRTLDGSALPLPRQEGDSWVVPVIEEVLVTEKRLVLVEEVWITQIGSTHRTQQHVTLRKEAIDIERLDAEEESATGRSFPPSPQGNATAPAGQPKENP